MIKLFSVLAISFVTIGIAQAQRRKEERRTDVQEAAREIRGQIRDIHQALAEITPTDRNAEEICFRVGSLYQTARYELGEVAAKQPGIAKPANQLIDALIKDAKSLPSFCGDQEKVKQDPGYEQVPKGDVADLKRELKNMDERASRLVALQ